MADRSLKLLSKNRLDDWSIVGCIRCHVSIFGRRSVYRSFLRSRAAPTRAKSEKPRKSREGKRSKRLKRQQQERKEKYRKRQCRANYEQHHQLCKLSATHDGSANAAARNFTVGPPTLPRTPRHGKVWPRLCCESGYVGIGMLWGKIIQRRVRRVISSNPPPPRASH